MCIYMENKDTEISYCNHVNVEGNCYWSLLLSPVNHSLLNVTDHDVCREMSYLKLDKVHALSSDDAISNGHMSKNYVLIQLLIIRKC